MLVFIALALGLRFVDDALGRVVQYADAKNRQRELGPRDCGTLGVLALTNDEFDELREQTARARDLHEFMERATA